MYIHYICIIHAKLKKNLFVILAYFDNARNIKASNFSQMFLAKLKKEEKKIYLGQFHGEQ